MQERRVSEQEASPEGARWNNACYAKHVLGRVQRPGALALACTRMECKHVPKDDFVWFTVDSHGERKKSSKRIARKWCVNFEAPYENSSVFRCVVAVPYEAGYQGRKVFGLSLAHNLHGHEGKARVFPGLTNFGNV